MYEKSIIDYLIYLHNWFLSIHEPFYQYKDPHILQSGITGVAALKLNREFLGMKRFIQNSQGTIGS
jgi:hypothetical protein